MYAILLYPNRKRIELGYKKYNQCDLR